jgi:hypothetical protein
MNAVACARRYGVHGSDAAASATEAVVAGMAAGAEHKRDDQRNRAAERWWLGSGRCCAERKRYAASVQPGVSVCHSASCTAPAHGHMAQCCLGVGAVMCATPGVHRAVPSVEPQQPRCVCDPAGQGGLPGQRLARHRWACPITGQHHLGGRTDLRGRESVVGSFEGRSASAGGESTWEAECPASLARGAMAQLCHHGGEQLPAGAGMTLHACCAPRQRMIIVRWLAHSFIQRQAPPFDLVYCAGCVDSGSQKGHQELLLMQCLLVRL